MPAEDEDDIPKSTVSLADTKQTSVDAGVEKVLLKFDAILFVYIERTAKNGFEGCSLLRQCFYFNLPGGFCCPS